jgi:hypothetical protein
VCGGGGRTVGAPKDHEVGVQEEEEEEARGVKTREIRRVGQGWQRRGIYL